MEDHPNISQAIIANRSIHLSKDLHLHFLDIDPSDKDIGRFYISFSKSLKGKGKLRTIKGDWTKYDRPYEVNLSFTTKPKTCRKIAFPTKASFEIFTASCPHDIGCFVVGGTSATEKFLGPSEAPLKVELTTFTQREDELTIYNPWQEEVTVLFQVTADCHMENVVLGSAAQSQEGIGSASGSTDIQ